MSELVTTIWGISLLIALVGCIPYGIWMVYTAVKKRWKRLGLMVTIPVGVFALLLGVSAIINAGEFERHLEGLVDAEVVLGQPLFEYDSKRAFNGDGYSISVYELPSSVRTRFEAADERLLSDFPKHPHYRDHWRFERWRRAPFDGRFKKYLDFALSSYHSDHVRGLADEFRSIREVLSGTGAYYAFFYYSHGDYLGDIDLFVVDLEGNRFYLINHNT